MTTTHEKKVLKQKLTTLLRGKKGIMFAYLFGSTARMEDNKKAILILPCISPKIQSSIIHYIQNPCRYLLKNK